MDLSNYRWRKFTDINRDFATFELMEGEIALIALSYHDSGDKLIVYFYEGVISASIEQSILSELLDVGRAMAEADR